MLMPYCGIMLCRIVTVAWMEINYNLSLRFEQNMQLSQEKQLLLPETLAGLNSDRKLSDSEDNLTIFVNNIVLFCRALESRQLDQQTVSELRERLKEQFNVMLFEERIDRFKDLLELGEAEWQPEEFEKKLYDLQLVLRQLMELKNNASCEEKYISYETEANKYISHLEFIINQPDIRVAVLASEALLEEQPQEKEGTSEIDIPSSHFFKERINTKVSLSPAVFSAVRPQSHQFYVTEAARAYHEITPFKIKTIALSLSEGPVISRPSYFYEGLDEAKAVLHYCIPHTKKVAYYSMADACKVHTLSKDYYHERELSNDWAFSPETRSIITPSGKIYAINCRTTKDKIDPYFYEIGESKASNRGPLPAGRRDAALLYMNGCVYLMGGRGEGEKCSKKHYRYSLREKKWTQLAESNVAVRKATVCALGSRYVLKLGGLNEFDYINKIIELYDSATDKWALVRASPRNILEEVQLLEDSLALQVSEDQVYVFGGRNSNNFSTDTGFVLVINEIREKKKGARKVSGEFWNVSIGKRNILTLFGDFSATTPLIHHNCIYGLRTALPAPLI